MVTVYPLYLTTVYYPREGTQGLPYITLPSGRNPPTLPLPLPLGKVYYPREGTQGPPYPLPLYTLGKDI